MMRNILFILLLSTLIFAVDYVILECPTTTNLNTTTVVATYYSADTPMCINPDILIEPNASYTQFSCDGGRHVFNLGFNESNTYKFTFTHGTVEESCTFAVNMPMAKPTVPSLNPLIVLALISTLGFVAWFKRTH